ncbi:MAG TPA: hypothetical protein VFN64_09610 [Burkholderiaceae bacterium]|nr:hypothetical protein [Burkholderiaceae bacterium]
MIDDDEPVFSDLSNDERLIEQLCVDLNAAHDEILRLQRVPSAQWAEHDWPEWSSPANSLRWAERRLNKPLSKTERRKFGRASA